MTLRQILAAAIAALTFTTHAFANEPDYVLVQRYEYSSESLDGESSGSGSGGSILSERIIQSQDGSLEIEYSIPGDFSKVRGNAMWMFPARVLVAPSGTKTLLNASELEERASAWLERAEWPREVCGQWIFTWTAFQVLCDPLEVIGQIEADDMRPGPIAAGATIRLPKSGTQAVLSEAGRDDLGRVFTASAPIDSTAIRRQAAQTRVITAQISGEELTIEDALEQTASITAEGGVTVTFTVDSDGLILKRTDSYEMTIIGDEHGDERRVGTSTVVRLSYEDWRID